MKVRVAISNLVMGQPVVDHFGVYTVDSTSGLRAVVELCKPKLLTFSAQTRKDSQHMVCLLLVLRCSGHVALMYHLYKQVIIERTSRGC